MEYSAPLPNPDTLPLMHPSRRDAALLLSIAPALSAAPKRFLSDSDFALLDELTDILIPTDDHSPGARAAQCAAFLDQQLNEAFEPAIPRQFRSWLAQFQALSQSAFRKPFLQLEPTQREQLVAQIADPKHPLHPFFTDLKERTIFAFYTSKIGIQDLDYKGNTVQREYSGTDVSKAE